MMVHACGVENSGLRWRQDVDSVDRTTDNRSDTTFIFLCISDLSYMRNVSRRAVVVMGCSGCENKFLSVKNAYSDISRRAQMRLNQ
jgi:hypothetical protein